MELEENLVIVYEEDNNRSAAYIDNVLVGICEYEIELPYWIITHTVVSPDHGGKGIAKKLVLKIIEEARNRKLKIKPICSYAKKVLDNPEYIDLL